MNRAWLVIAALAALLGGLGAFLLIRKPPDKAAPPGPPSPAAPASKAVTLGDTLWRVPVLPDDPVLGAEQPLVTIIHFDDMAAPSCRVMSSYLRKLIEIHPEDVRWVWKDRPNPSLRPLGMTAALFARYAYANEGDRGFFRVHALSVERLAADDVHAVSPIGALFDMSEDETRAAQARSLELGAKVDASMRLAQALQIRTTPALLINGRMMSGLPSWQEIEAVVEEQLAAARAVLARGVPRDRLYAELIEQAKEPAVVAESGPPLYGPGRRRIKHQAETEIDRAEGDTTPVELSTRDLTELQRRNIDPERFKRFVRTERAREAMVEEALRAREEAALQ
jgi:protein-disulfide isomerase